MREGEVLMVLGHPVDGWYFGGVDTAQISISTLISD